MLEVDPFTWKFKNRICAGEFRSRWPRKSYHLGKVNISVILIYISVNICSYFNSYIVVIASLWFMKFFRIAYLYFLGIDLLYCNMECMLVIDSKHLQVY